ncbi:MAG: SCO family protein [Anaerolineae bacterium]|nr:SCO family protein [Anaerolineae bacterium]
MDQATETAPSAVHSQNFWQNKILRFALLGLGIGIGLGALFLAIRPLFGPTEWHGMVIQSYQPVTNFTLTSSNGEPVSLIDFRGKVVMLYFGYTFCPDVCPATMIELSDAMEILGDKSEDVQVVMITLDPERDTPEVMQKYVTHFNDTFIGLTGTPEELIAVTAPMGIFYERHEGSSAAGYLIDHTATVAVLDKEGKLRLVYPFGVTGADMAADLKYLVRE